MLELIGQHACFGGTQRFYRHDSTTIGLPMRFALYMPPQAQDRRVPALFYLAGLTCTEETFPIKAGAQRYAAEHGIALIAPDTSPRGANLAGENDSWDFGVGAGFYLDATESPWSKHYRMYSYVLHELRETVLREFQIDGARLGVFGHSMGGHGALVLALRNRDVFRSVSAFAPIAAPSRCPWGVKAFNGYLGHDQAAWAQYDATELVKSLGPLEQPVLIDQGLGDAFLAEQLHPDLFEAACAQVGQALTLRKHADYDHGYYFVQSFVGDHIRHHAQRLTA